MEKYAIVVCNTNIENKFIKTGDKRESLCEHPVEAIITEGDVKFCEKCGCYLKGEK